MLYGFCDSEVDVQVTDVIRNMWIVREETGEFGGFNMATTSDCDMLLAKGNVGIKMSFNKWYESWVALRACPESIKIELEKAENVIEDVLRK